MDAADVRKLEEDLKIASKILEWEIGDIWGHVGVRLPENHGIAVKLFRSPEDEEEEDWLVHFDYSLNKLSGVGTPPRESTIYTEIFKARPDVNAAVHSHAPMCVALSLADQTVSCVHMQSGRFARGVPIYPDPKPPYDRTGAGDAFSSTFVAAIIRGADVAEALLWAPINAMSVVQKVGAQSGLLSEPEISHFIREAPANYHPERLVN